MNYQTNIKKIKLSTMIGLILVVSALSIWLFSATQIQTNENILNTQNIPIEETWKAQGALQWWNNAYTTAIAPATTILTLAGIASILSPKLLYSFKQKNTLNNFEKEIQKACKI
jgi:uncharacterized membrane protein